MKCSVCFDIGDFETAYKKGMDLFEDNTAKTEAVKKLKLAYEEVFVNILMANENSGVEVSITIESDKDRVEVCIKDGGMEFDPLKAADPNIMLSIDERNEGGLGIFLFKQYTDYARYEYKDNYNILTFGIYLS